MGYSALACPAIMKYSQEHVLDAPTIPYGMVACVDLNRLKFAKQATPMTTQQEPVWQTE
jgi:hypothetical protein